jgi:hypothetical protein
MGFGRDLCADSLKPLLKPLSHRQPRRVDMLAGIERAKEPAQFLLGILAPQRSLCIGPMRRWHLWLPVFAIGKRRMLQPQQ